MEWMLLRQLDWLLRTRGPTLAEWPDRDRAAAMALLRRSARARQMLADMLAQEDAPTPDPAVLCGMLRRLRAALAPASPMVNGARWGALLACAAVGLWLGLAFDDSGPTPELFPVVQVASLP